MKLLIPSGILILTLTGSAVAVIGGEFSRDGEFPFAISLVLNGRPFCTGLLVDYEFVLSTCHCVGVFHLGAFAPLEPDHIQLAGGDPWISPMRSNTNSLQMRQCTQIIIHPNCTDEPWGWGYDYSLLRARIRFHLSSTLQPMELPYYNPESLYRVTDDYINSKYGCYAVGWGEQLVVDRRINSRPSERLKASFVQLLSWPECLVELCSVGPKKVCETTDDKYRGKACAVGVGGSAACDLDDGGPVVCDGYLIALMSKGVDCGRYVKPRTILRLDFALGFIRELIAYNIESHVYEKLKEPLLSL